MKKIFLFATVLVLFGLSSCDKKTLEENPQKNQTLLSIKKGEKSFDFTSNSPLKDFSELLSGHFRLFPNSFLIVKSSKDQNSCDYGFGRLDDKFGKEIIKEIDNKENYKTSDNNEFDTWIKSELSRGNFIIICYIEETGEFIGIS